MMPRSALTFFDYLDAMPLTDLAFILMLVVIIGECIGNAVRYYRH